MSSSASPCATPMTGLSPTELDTCAQYAWLSGRIGEAIDLYSDLARVHKRSPHVHFKLGYLYLALQDHTSAIKHFTSEIERYGDDVADSPLTSRSPPSSPITSTAATAMTAAVPRSAPLNLQQCAFLFCTYAGRSEAFHALGEVTKADLDLLFVTNRRGDTTQSLLAMGGLYFRFGMHQRADRCFEKCSATDGDDPEYLVEHAELRLAQRRYAVAASMFEKCRQNTSSTTPTYHRALIGQGAALIRQNKLQDAMILLLQAMNTLRNMIQKQLNERNAFMQSSSSGPSASAPATMAMPPATTTELIHQYHRAVNLYGGLCLMKGELKAALDTYCSLLQPTAAFTNIVAFHLPTICIIPGTKNQLGEVVDSAKISTKNLSEAVRHLNEMEWRYGPDACLYFHRASIHRATGEFDAFVHDLSLVESMDSDFLKKYVARDSLGDFLDVETIAWIPTTLVESLHDALECNEYRIPPANQAAVVGNAIAGSRPLKSKSSSGQSTMLPKHRAFSEVAMLTYLQGRAKYNTADDVFAHVFQLDLFRRLPESRRKPGKIHSVELLPWEGVVFDDVHTGGSKPSDDDDKPLQDLLRTTLSTHRYHPCAHMFAGMIELEKFNVAAAGHHFGEAIALVDRSATASAPKDTRTGLIMTSSLSHCWHQLGMQQVKYYSLVWRSMASRIKIEMEKAVEDLNVAAAVRLGEKITGSDDPLLLIQRTLILLLNGHLKSAYKLLRQLKKSLRRARRHRPKSRRVLGSDAAEVIDMFSNAGLNSFHLMHLQVQKESTLVMSSSSDGATDRHRGSGTSAKPLWAPTAQERAQERAEEERDERDEEEAAIAMVKYALSKKGVSPAEMLDKFYESGLLKLSLSGSISQVIPFFQAILSMDEGYLPPTNFASLEIFKCKEQEFMEEKLFNCFVRLGKRSKWLEKKIKWKFEALIDSNLAHAYLPSDIETLWHRARLMQDQTNFVAAINDLTDCLHLMAPHFSWERGKIGEKAKFNNDTKRIQWLQLQLERGMLHMELYHWEHAISDLNMVIAQAGKKNPMLQASAYEARSSCLIHLRRYGHAIQDLQHLLMVSKEAKKTKKPMAIEETRRREDRLLNYILVGNLYCQLAVDQMKASSAFSRKTSFPANPLAMKEAKLAHVNRGFLTRATEYYDEAEQLMPDHFLAHYFRGRMFAIAGQSQLATRSLTECLRLHSMFLPALFLRGCVYAQENLFVLALADFYRVRHRVSTYPNLHTSIGFCHLERGSLGKAVESFTEAILQRPDDLDALYMRGCALQELMVLSSALRDFERVVALSPEHYRAHYQHAVCNILTKHYKQALSDTSVVVRLQPEWRDAWILHGYASFCAEKYDLAVASYGSAIALPDATDGNDNTRAPHASLFMDRAFAYIRAGKYTAALADLDLAVKRDNENYLAYIARAYCLSQMGERTRAAQALAHCLPHYKQIRLPDATQILDSERGKAQWRLETSSHDTAVSVGSGFGSGMPLPAADSTTKNASTSIIAANADTLFQYRKHLRDCEPKQILRPLSQMLAERRTSSTNVTGVERRTSNMGIMDRRSSSNAAPPSSELSVRKSRLFSTASTVATMEAAAEMAKARTKQLLRAKFLRVLKKITFQHRVLKALENSTSSKYKKSQQMTRMLAEILQPTTAVSWPKGTLTTRILLWAFNAFGIHQAHEQTIDDALMAFTLAIQAHPYNGDAYFNRGNVYLRLAVLPSAVSSFGDAIDQDESCFRAHNNMGVALYKMTRLEEAQDAFSIGLHHASHAKERAILMYNLGVTFQALDKQDEALEFYQQAIALDASRTEFFNNRSAILHHQMRYAVALEDYNRALKLQQDQRHQSHENEQDGAVRTQDSDRGYAARLNRAQLYIAMGNCTLASRDLTIVLKTLCAIKDVPSPALTADDHSFSSSNPLHAAGAVAKAESLEADAQLATELLAFCQKWHTAMRIAVKDFLFALHAVPCFAVYQLSPLFGPELVRLQERETHASETKVSRDADWLDIVPLPIPDASFFDYDRAFSHWIVLDDRFDENEGEDREPQLALRVCKREQWAKSYVGDVRDAMRCARDGDFHEAARWLLRAHYKTTLDSHDEYLLLTWRIQVTMKITESVAAEGGDDTVDTKDGNGLTQAIVLLRDFLWDRRTPEEIARDEDDDDNDAQSRSDRRPQLSAIDDGDDDLDDRVTWRLQRRVIRADLFTLLGSFYQLNGQVVEARASFQRALQCRSDHVIAMLNFLQLGVVVGEYESALDTSLRLLEMFVHFGNDPHKNGPSATKRIPMGLLNADRSVSWMLPSIATAFTSDEMAALGLQLLTLLKEYRGLVSAQIQTNTTHIFKTQGAIAHAIQELRQVVSSQKTVRARTPQSSGLPLVTFNDTLDAYRERVIRSPARIDDAFYESFQAQFADLCEQVATTLPVNKDDDDRITQDVNAADASITDPDQDDAEQTIEQFLATIERREENTSRQMSSGRARTRPATGPSSASGSSDATSLSSRRSSSTISGASFQPQRPASGPQYARARRSYT